MSIKNILSAIMMLGVLSCTTTKYQTAEITGTRIPINNSITADTSIQNFIKPYSEHLNETLDTPLAYNPTNLDKSEGELNTAIGNLMADIIMEQVNPIFHSRTGKDIDFVLLNHGGIRASIGKGNVTSRTAYQLMPFENEIVVVELSGQKTRELLTYLENSKTAHPVSGIQLKVDKNYKVISAKVKGKEIETNRNYLVATSDYLQTGGDNMIFFKEPVKLYRTDYKLRNTIIDYFTKIDTISTAIDNRYIQIP
ncbi:5'-nucleotidase C-terminal domain-containing protein [Gillisia sp. M10.2A]|uniref:5'-nucleotidase C-terminal domain-containing protein n=1 Tax=Gillisia lutea TaxID=2909668 RepID=A0ABS9EF79_9FLAO|nr:5'-nucleotidase [Gillisia lutea]MCF4100927.1 5'-nucleotidase C-terminal domain-containing protein [Gillisia lutea]